MSAASDLSDHRLPYPGLRPFRRDESDLFFGRESCVDEMVARLAATRFLAVLGPSGSGKSSLVRTGLLDALELGLMAAAGPRWLIADMRPGTRPIDNLARALLALGTSTEPASPARPDASDPDALALARKLRRGPRSLIEWSAEGNLPERANLLLLVDQFEELFRYADLAGRNEAEAFVSLLINSAAAADLQIYVVLTMRSEFLGPSALIPELAERINQGLYLTRRMSRDEIREAIVGPASVCGFAIEPILVNTLLNDLASFAPWEGERGVEQFQLLARRADQLPLLQHVLNRLWLEARAVQPAADVTLRLQAYQALGGLAGALDAHAEEVLAGISPAHRDAAAPVFRALVSGSSIATAVRRPCRMSELIALAGDDAAAVTEIVEAYRDPGCNFLVASSPGALEPETTIDISHESLIRQWQRLSQWLAAEAKAADEYRYLDETASRWANRRSSLLRMPYLATALAWQARERPTEVWARRYGGDFPLAMRFLEQSSRRQRIWHRSRLGAGVLAGLLVAAGVPYLYLQHRTLKRLQAATAADNAGISALNGQGGHQDYATALQWFQKAMALGSVDAVYQMGRMHEDGQGTPPDDNKAFALYRMAAAKGLAGAEFELGYFYDEGRGTKQDYVQAMAWYQKAAAQGNVAADNNIGYLYDSGHGVKPDPKQAMTWYQKAAAGGDSVADDNIGYLWEHGRGVKADPATALAWYRKAANQGNADAAFNIGRFYEYGIGGIKPDRGSALYWYRTAANGGSTDGVFEVGYFYGHGIGVMQDYTEAMAWFFKAAARRDAAAEDNIGYLYEHGRGTAQDYNEAVYWFQRAAADGSQPAMNSLGLLYQNGRGVTRNITQALTWYRKAAAAGSSGGAFNLGWLYENGTGVARDPVAAMQWYLKAANAGSADAAFKVGFFYNDGIGVAQNYAEAARWYEKAAAGGNSSAQNNLGYLFERGRGVPKDYVQAMTWYRKAAAGGDHVAEKNIGYLYDHGLGVGQDYEEAASWYRKAAIGGDRAAQFKLGVLYASGRGVPKDNEQAKAWFEKAAAQGDADAPRRIGEILDAQKSFDSARTWLDRAAQLARNNVVQHPNDPDAKGRLNLAAAAYGNLSYDLLLSGAFAKGLDAANAATALAPNLVWLQTNRADALMLLGQTDAARTIYLRYQAVTNDGSDDGKSFKQDVLADFVAFRTHGFSSPLMAEIESDFSD